MDFFVSFMLVLGLMENNQKNAGILIPTMNRPDFVIRQLNYYASVNCLYPIYIVDSSDKENFEKLENFIKKLGNKLSINHVFHPPGHDCMSFGVSMVKEKYIAYSGDDDYQIPNCISKCVDFLNSNPDHVMASGKSVSIRLKTTQIYGEIERIADYPRPEINGANASQRTLEYFSKLFPTDFYIHRKNEFLESMKGEDETRDRTFGTEIYRGVTAIIPGKSKTIDELGLIRQIHNSHYNNPNTFDWIASDKWLDSYKIFMDKVSLAISRQDNIPTKEAEYNLRKGFWLFVQKQMNTEYIQVFPSEQLPKRSSIKIALGNKFPKTKWLYKKALQKLFKKPIPLHYAVLQPSSKYYKDFKPIMDSLSEKLTAVD